MSRDHSSSWTRVKTEAQMEKKYAGQPQNAQKGWQSQQEGRYCSTCCGRNMTGACEAAVGSLPQGQPRLRRKATRSQRLDQGFHSSSRDEADRWQRLSQGEAETAECKRTRAGSAMEGTALEWAPELHHFRTKVMRDLPKVMAKGPSSTCCVLTPMTLAA